MSIVSGAEGKDQRLVWKASKPSTVMIVIGDQNDSRFPRAWRATLSFLPRKLASITGLA